MTRLTYLSEARIPSSSTNATATMRMCGAFAEAGADVTVVHPLLRQPVPEGFAGDVAAFYGMPASVQRRVLRVRYARARNPAQRVVRAMPYLTYLVGRGHPRQPPFVCYTRTYQLAWLAARARGAWGRRSACRALIMEVHDEPPARGWSLLETVDGVIAISDALRSRILRRLPALEGRVWVERSGFDPTVLHRGIDRGVARAKIGFEHAGGPVVVYAGRVFKGKGVDVLLEAAALLEGIGARILVVGNVQEPDYVARASENVTFTGFVAPSEVPDYLAAADVLVMPSTGTLRYAEYTSPLKLFEYLATGNPVVASDLPVLREVLRDGENALLYPPHDGAALAEAL
ncbi:MAG: glycosyltransferase family 4 protein, partial [Acidimicrobiales bacterium]